MPIRLIDADERFEIEIEETRFVYRRLTRMKQRLLEKEHSTRGDIDFEAFGYAVLDHCLLDWGQITNGDGTAHGGVVDAEGNEIPFNAAYIEALPTPVTEQLIRQMSRTVAGEVVDPL